MMSHFFKKFFLCFLVNLAFGFVQFARAEIIAPANRVDWVPGATVGVQGRIPIRTKLIDVTKPPYNADKSGVANAAPAIQAAINAAANENVIYLPDGRYRLNTGLALNKSYITLRGQSTNAILMGLGAGGSVLEVGHNALSRDLKRSLTVISGAEKGSTNLIFESTVNRYGDVLKSGDVLLITHKTRGLGTATFPVISTGNYDNIIKQTVVVHSRSGNSVNITAPLAWNFTNSPTTIFESATVIPARVGIGLENLSITLTNSGESGKAAFLINAGSLRDSWFRNLDLGFANNYQLYLTASVNCEVSHNTIHNALSHGTSHAGLILAGTSGLLVEDNIFANGLYPAIEVNDGVMGCAFVGNYFTNNSLDVDMHNSHPMMNVFEQNIFNSFFEMDGYFGSSSHFTLLRNRIFKTTPLKRWTTYMQIIGNICGSSNAEYVFSKEQSGYGAPWPLFEMGYPNIGNNAFTGSSPSVPWNFPGKDFFWSDNTESGTFPNGIYTFTNTQVNVTNLIGNFTNIPPRYVTLVFQDGINTNIYHSGTSNSAIVNPLAPAGMRLAEWKQITATNLPLNAAVTVSNGWKLFAIGAGMYQQLQSGNKYTHTFHGNLLYTNGIGNGPTLSWDPGIADHTIPASLVYIKKPSWWGTNRWPAISPDSTPATVMIPAEARYLGIPYGLTTPPPPVSGLKINPGTP